MSTLTLLLIVLVVLVVGALPQFEAHPFGYGPSSVAGLVLLLLVILLLLGRL